MILVSRNIRCTSSLG